MRFGVVSNLVTHARREHEIATVLQFCVQFAADAKQYVSIAAPVIREVASRVIDHADTIFFDP